MITVALYVTCNVVNCYLLSVNKSLLPLCNYDSPITSHRWREGEKRQGLKLNEASIILVPKCLKTEQHYLEFHIAIDEAVNIQLKLNLFSWASLFHHIFELYLDEAFRSICDYALLDRKCF